MVAGVDECRVRGSTLLRFDAVKLRVTGASSGGGGEGGGGGCGDGGGGGDCGDGGEGGNGCFLGRFRFLGCTRKLLIVSFCTAEGSLGSGTLAKVVVVVDRDRVVARLVVLGGILYFEIEILCGATTKKRERQSVASVHAHASRPLMPIQRGFWYS